MAKKYTLCKCGTRNDRIGGRSKCVSCAKPLRKLPQQRHKLILRDGYAPFERAAREIHGVTDESCCVCGKPRPQEGRWDRDHDHVTGVARGLACSGNQGCNVLMAKWVSAATAAGIAQAKFLAGEPDADRWSMIARYLSRCEVFYSREAVQVG
jgi:hypothetical protein